MMIKHFHKHFFISTALVLALGFVGCNIFNPAENARISNNDAPALTYEAYLHYQKNEYSEARDYFEKAIKADSTYSEAWVGRAKAVMNMQPGLNLFSLASKANIEGGADAMASLMAMPDSEATLIKNGVDSVLFYLDPFIARDTLSISKKKLTDKKVRFKDIADSYSILQLIKLALTVRAANTSINDLLTSTENFLTVDWSTLDIEQLGETVKEVTESLASTASAIKANPELATTIVKEFIPDTMNITDSAIVANIDFFADQIIYVNDAVQNADLDRSEVFLSVGNAIDDDGDGCVDEEIPDGQDNDGDGEIDEDMRHYKTYVMDIDSVNPLKSNPTKIREIGNIDHYRYLDVDGNGIYSPDDIAERTFVYPNTKERESKGNHLLVFADSMMNVDSLKWIGGVSDLDKRIANKDKARLDTDSTNIKYDLEWRKKNIGGCWLNYDEDRFKAWFRGRSK